MRGIWRVGGGDGGDDDANEIHDRLGGNLCMHNNLLAFSFFFFLSLTHSLESNPPGGKPCIRNNVLLYTHSLENT